MEDYISDLVSSFSRFLPEAVNKQKEISKNCIISFAAPFKNSEIRKNLDYLVKLYETSFYYELPQEKYSFLALDEIFSISENGDRRFAATDKTVKGLKGNIINNWSNLGLKKVPLFAGGMRFTVEHPDNDWKDFNDSHWFVPEILVLNDDGNQYILFNLLLPSRDSKEKIIEKYSLKLKNLFNSRDKIAFYPPRITTASGSSPKDKKKWKLLLNEALDRIQDNLFSKVVLSRKIEVSMAQEINLNHAISNFQKNYSCCCLFIFHRGKSSFFGATPEMLLKLQNGIIETDSLAGSAPRGKTEQDDLRLEEELRKSSKNLNEHNFVVQEIKKDLSPFSSEIKVSANPEVKKFTNIQHLSTKITARLNSSSSMFTLLNELHPTAAVCGYPKNAALGFIRKKEQHRRGLYSGIMGWFNLEDEGEFAVAIRSALSSGNRLIAFAGSGIVKDSDPDEEFEETEIKLKPILSLFNEDKN